MHNEFHPSRRTAITTRPGPLGMNAAEEWAERRRIAGLAERVGIGEFAITYGSVSLRATLGSCVGVCLAHPKTKRVALAHVLLPTKGEKDRGEHSAARCADTVVPLLLKEMRISRSRRHEIVAFVAGGAALYTSGSQRSEVGKDNASVLIKELQAHGIYVAGRDLGGKASRQIVVDGSTGRVFTLVLDEKDQGKAWPDPVGFIKPRAAA